jgi:hypothetical protein
MTSPRFAEATAQGRYYHHPVTGQQLVSVTNILSVACAKPALIPWAVKVVTEKAWNVLPRMVAASRKHEDCKPTRPNKDWEPCGVCWGCLNREVKGEANVVRDKASDLGTRIHNLAEAHILRKPMAPDDEAAPYVEQYEKFLADFDVDITKDIEATELTVANPALGYAGTLDLLVWLRLDGFIPGQPVKVNPDGKRSLWLLDFKSSATRAATSTYPEYALQLAGLRHAREMWLPDDSIVPMMRGITGAACLNLRKSTYAMIPLPTGNAEFDAFKGGLVMTKWMHSGPTNNAQPVLPDGSTKPKATRGKKKTITPPTDDTDKAA